MQHTRTIVLSLPPPPPLSPVLGMTVFGCIQFHQARAKNINFHFCLNVFFVFRPRLSETDFQKYNRQFQLTTNICQEFEAETAKSGEADKKARFERVMLLMQV